MEFWGVEVKPGQALTVKPGDQKILHLSQATIGELKDKANDSVTVFLKIDGQKLVLGILSAEKFPQISFDLVFEKEFELSHNGKSGSIYCLGYQASSEDHEHEEYSDSDFDSEEEEPTLVPAENGKPSEKEKAAAGKILSAKPESSKKADVKSLEPSKEDEDDSEDDDDSDEDEDSDDDSDEEMIGDDSGSDDEDDGTGSDEETPKKVVESGKKRSKEPASTTPTSKKAKLASAEKTDSKKGGHTATPHPAKKKTPGKAETPKSGGQFSCKSCDRSFGSDGALQSHSKAKHGGK